MFSAAADDIISSVFGPEILTAVHESWSSAKDAACNVIANLPYIGHQQQSDGRHIIMSLCILKYDSF